MLSTSAPGALLRRSLVLCALVALSAVGSSAMASVTVQYNVDAGGSNANPLNGLRAEGEFDITGTTLKVTLTNTSSGVPLGTDFASSLLTTVGFNLPAGVSITAGISALVTPGSQGQGSWALRAAGASVGDEWIWSNEFGGDLLNSGQSLSSRQIISTLQGFGGGAVSRFDGGAGTVSGPKGGMTAKPPLVAVPGPQYAVSNSIMFTVTLNQTISEFDLASVAAGSVVEFGSNARYLSTGIPAPGPIAAACGLSLLALRRPRRD